MKIFASSLALIVLGTATPAIAQVSTPASESRPTLLRALDGNWRMSGDVKGQQVSYSMRAASALQGTFTEMRMKDVQVPAQYEAVVFIGFDTTTQTIIAHWMDNHGPKYSIPHATGHISGDSIQLLFPYPSGNFRNTLTYNADSASWTFVLESAQPDGSWKHFARYEAKRI